MKKLSELLPEKKEKTVVRELYRYNGKVDNVKTYPSDSDHGYNECHDQATKALDTIDPTKIRFSASLIDIPQEVVGYYYSECDYHYIFEDKQKESMLKRNVPHRIDPSTLQILIEE